MTPSVIEALMWAGITPPKNGGRKATCPKCSHTRKKSWERCLRIEEPRPGVAQVYCYHCQYEDFLS